MHRTSAEVRADASHPIIDADGHMLEVLEASYPYLRQALGAAQFQAWLDRGSIAKLSQRPRTPDERRRTRTPQGAVVGHADVSTCATRATATLPALLPRAHGRDRHRLHGALPDQHLAHVRRARRRPPARPVPRLQRLLRRRVRRLRRSHDRGGDHPDAHPRRGGRGARALRRDRHQGRVLPRGRRPRARRDPRRRLLTVARPRAAPLVRLVRARQRPRLRPRVGPRANGSDSRRPSTAALTVRPGLHWSISSYVANHIGQFAAEMYPTREEPPPRRRDHAVPASAVRAARVRCVVGDAVAGRHHRALGEAQPRRHGAAEPGAARQGGARSVLPAVRRQAR